MLSALLCLVCLGCWSVAQDLSPPYSILNKLSFEPEKFQPRESLTQRGNSPDRFRQPNDGRQQRRSYTPEGSQGLPPRSEGPRESFTHPQVNSDRGARALPHRVPEPFGRRGSFGDSQNPPEHSTEYNPYRPQENHFSQSERSNLLPRSQQNPFGNRDLVRPVETHSRPRYPGQQAPSSLVPIHHEGPTFGERHSPEERYYPREVSPDSSHEGPLRRVPYVKPIGGFDNLADSILTGKPSRLLDPEVVNTGSGSFESPSTNRKPSNDQFDKGYTRQIYPNPQYGTDRSPTREPQYRQDVPNDSRLFPTENHNSRPNSPLLPIPEFGVPLGPPKPIVPVHIGSDEQRRDPTYDNPSDLRVKSFDAPDERHRQSDPARADQYSQYPGAPPGIHQGRRNHQPVQQPFRYPPGGHGVLADQPNQQHFPVGPGAQQDQLNQQYLPVGHGGKVDQPNQQYSVLGHIGQAGLPNQQHLAVDAGAHPDQLNQQYLPVGHGDRADLSGVGHESYSPVYTAPTGQQGQQYTPPTGQQGQQYTPPTGQQEQQYTPPTDQQRQQYTPPTSQQGQQYIPPTTQQGQQYTPPTGQQEQQYTPPTGQQGQQYTLPTGQQEQQYTPPTSQQGQQYIPPTTQQGQQYIPPSGQQGQQYTPPSGQQGQQYNPAEVHQEQQHFSPGSQGQQYPSPANRVQYQDQGSNPVSQPGQTHGSFQSPDTNQDQTHTEYPSSGSNIDAQRQQVPYDSNLSQSASPEQAVNTSPNLPESDASPPRHSVDTEIIPTLPAFHNAAGPPGKVRLSPDQTDTHLPDVSHSATPNTAQGKPETLNVASVVPPVHYGERAPVNTGTSESSGHAVPSTSQGNKHTDEVQPKLSDAEFGPRSVQGNPTPHKQVVPTPGTQVPVLSGSAVKQTVSDALGALNPSNSHFVPPGLQGQCYKYKDLSAGYSPSDDSFEYPDDAISAEMREKTFLAPILGFKNFAQPDTQFGLIPFGNLKGNNNQHINDYLYSANVYPTGYKEGDFKMATPSDYTCRSTQTTLRMFKLYGGRCWTVNPDYQRVSYKICGAPGLHCGNCSNSSRNSGGGGKCSEDYEWVKVWGYCEKATPGQRVRQLRLYLPTGCSCKTYYC